MLLGISGGFGRPVAVRRSAVPECDDSGILVRMTCLSFTYLNTCVWLFLAIIGCSTQSNTLGAGQCRVDSDCTQYENCLSPNQLYHCGPISVGMACTDNLQCNGLVCSVNPAASDAGHVCAQAVTCTTDSECEGGQVCRKDPKIEWLEPDTLVCSEPCKTNRDCVETDICDDTGHCQARTCGECPSYFSCTSGSCVIPNCASDAQCPAGHCVMGRCAGTLGTCQMLCF